MALFTFSSPVPSAMAAEPNKLFVSNLAAGTTEDDLRFLFSQFGNIIDCLVMEGKGRGGRHAAFVKYATVQEAEQARLAMDRHIMDGDVEPITVRTAGRKPPKVPIVPFGYTEGGATLLVQPEQRIPLYPQPELKRPPARVQGNPQKKLRNEGTEEGYKLYVSNLEPTMDEEALFSLFAPYGNVIETVVIRQKAGHRGRLSGFVRFSDPNTANLVVQTMNGVIPVGFTERITVKFAKE